eukprot:4152991-Pyramimonas_sp.AAC.1
MGLVMYMSYFWLFSLLFLNKYFGAKPKPKADLPPSQAPGLRRRQDSRDMNLLMCGVDLGTHDGAGFFHSPGHSSYSSSR